MVIKKNKLTICLFNSTKSWGGGEYWHYLHALALQKAGYDVVVITNIDSKLFDRLKDNNKIRVVPILISKLDFINPIKLKQLSNVFRKLNIDLIIFNDSTDVKIGSVAAKWAGISKIIYRRGLANIIKKSFVNKYIYNKIITGFIANSQETKKTIITNYPEINDKIKVIYNGFPLNDFLQRKSKSLYTRKEDELVIGNAGRLTEQKGQIHLLNVVHLLKEKNIKVKLLIAGIGELEDELKQKTIDLDIEAIVDFVGFVDDMKSFMQSIDIFVFPSLWEGFGFVLTEAMACKKPIVCFDITSNPELVENGVNGFLVPVKNESIFAERIIELANNKKKLEELGENGYNKLLSNFTLVKSIEEIEKHIIN